LFAGIFLNLITAITFSLSFDLKSPSKTIRITALVCTFPLFTSWFFLTDAFRRFRNTKTHEQVVNNFNIGVLSLAFVFYAVG
jgi:hypothetical protein